MASNQTLLAKADLALSDLTSNGGILQPEQAQRFIRLLIKEAVLMKLAYVKPMKSYKALIEKTRFATRVLRAGVTGTALPDADRSKPTMSKVELDVKLFKAQVNLDDETLEDNIEDGDLKNTVLQMMAEAVSRDVDEIMISGDTASSDTFLAQFDGILKAATSNVVNAGSAALDKNILRDMIKTMPKEFLRRKNSMKFLTSVNAEIDYRDSLSDRVTALGDANIVADNAVPYSGIGIIPIPMMPENIGSGSVCTDVILTDPKNITLGIWRNITFEWDKNIETGVTMVVCTMRMDTKYAEETAVVKAINVLAQ